MTRYVVVHRYENFKTGEKWERQLPKRYKTRRGAEAAAYQHRYVTRPGASSAAVDNSDAWVVEVRA